MAYLNLNLNRVGLKASGRIDQKDFIVTLGESVGEGRGLVYGPNVPAGTAYAWTDVSTLIELNDPVGGANVGSICPSLANSYYSASGGRVPIIAECCRGSAVLTSTANSDPGYNYTKAGGSLYNTLLTRTDAGLLAIGKIYPTALICMIGLNDAAYMDLHPEYTKAIVKAAFYDLIDRLKTKYPLTPFFIVTCGRLAGVMTTGCNTMNEIFAEAEAFYAHVKRCFTTTDTFTFANGNLNFDGTHWSQTGNNTIGATSGSFIYKNRYF